MTLTAILRGIAVLWCILPVKQYLGNRDFSHMFEETHKTGKNVLDLFCKYSDNHGNMTSAVLVVL